MKQPIAVVACLLAMGCGRSGPEAGAAPAASAPRPKAAQAVPPETMTGPASIIVPVEDNAHGIPDAVYPSLPGRFSAITDVTPDGWRVEHRVEGDVDGDRRADLVLVLRQDSARNRIEHDGLGESPLDANPRLLLVGLARDAGYALVVRNHRFIPRHVVPTFQDALVGAPEVRDGVLSIRLEFFASAGSWSMSHSTFRFRWRDGALGLIGHDVGEVQRNTGETVDRSVNFLTRRVNTVTSSIEAEVDPPAVWTRLPPGPLPTIDDVGDGLAFDPVAGD